MRERADTDRVTAPEGQGDDGRSEHQQPHGQPRRAVMLGAAAAGVGAAAGLAAVPGVAQASGKPAGPAGRNAKGATAKHVFQVTISGLELDDEQVKILNQAVQTAILSQVAALSFPDFSAVFPRPPVLGLVLEPPDEGGKS
jgi:hypothetical protein